MKKKHGEELRKYWREQKRKYRAKRKGNKITVFDETGKPIVKGTLIDIDKIPKITRRKPK